MPRIESIVIHAGPQGTPGATGAPGSPGPAGTPKGTVATVGALPASGNTVGDLYMVSGTSHAYGWNGTAWVDLGLFTANAWGTLTGTLSSQTDLNTALAGKASTTSVTQITPGDRQQVIGGTTLVMGPVEGNVRAASNGAVGNGTTDDRAAFQTALIADGSVPTPTRVPRGTYGFASSLTLRGGTCHIRGDGTNATVIKPTTTFSNLILSSGSLPISHLIVEDITFDGASLSILSEMNLGPEVARATFRRCRFINLGANVSGLNLNGIGRVAIEDCDFSSAGNFTGQGILLGNGCYDVAIRRNRFDWLHDGITISGGTSTDNQLWMEKVVIEDNRMDMYWWLGRVQGSYANSGGTVTYGAQSLTDTAASFSGLSVPYNVNVRVMPVRQTTSATTFFRLKVTATDGAFVTNGVQRGDIIRASTSWAVVSSVVSNTELNVESWYDNTTMAPVVSPSNGTSMTIYGVILANINSFTATTLTMSQPWMDVTGAQITPAAGTRYEVLVTRPNYQIACNQVAQDVIVRNNLIRRGWSDQVSVYSGRATITGNVIEDGEDIGITLNGGVGGTYGQSIIAHNTIRHQGTSGIYCTAPDTLIEGNQVIGAAWTDPNDSWVTGIAAGGNRCRVIANVVDTLGRPNGRYGISYGYPYDGGAILDNSVRNASVADVRLWGSSTPSYPTNVHVRGKTTVYHTGSGWTVPGQFYELRGSGSPEGVVTAGPGSTWLDLTNGKLYVKGSGTGSTGWVAQA